MNPEEFRREAHELIDWICDYRRRIDDLPVRARVGPGDIRNSLPATPPEQPEPFADVMRDLEAIVVPGITQVQHPMHFGWFPSNASLASVLGDFASSGLGTLGISWESCPALTEVEEVVCDWMRQLVGLSDAWEGTIHDTASTACLTAMILAREKATGYGETRGGLQQAESPLVVYTTEEAHSSVRKAALLAGFGADNIRNVPVDARTRAMLPEALGDTIERDLAAGAVPAVAVASVGSTGITRHGSGGGPWPIARGGTASGFTSMPPWPAPPCCCPNAGTSGRAWRARTRSPGIRTSGWARSSTAPCSTCATPSTWSA